MRYYIIAGEASGDLHASNLMRELKRLDTAADFRCWGGDLMEAQGGVLVKHYRDLAFMGFTEVVLNLRTILSNISFCKQDILAYRPDAVILVDYPGFNLRIAEFAKQNGIKVIYYISPQVWAWKQSRVKKIRKVVDRMMVILPFEKDFYRKFDYDVEFTGHPLLDAIEQRRNRMVDPHKWKKENGISEKPLVLLLPGSRVQEISTMLPVMLSVAERFPDYQFVVGGAPSVSPDLYRKYIGERNVAVIHNQTYSLLEVAHAALVTSGTATLETALFNVPEVVCYKGGQISYYIARALVKIKYISLVNLIMDREIVKELIQDEMNVEKVSEELRNLLEPSHRARMLDDFADLRKKLGGSGASAKAAAIIQKELLQVKSQLSQ